MNAKTITSDLLAGLVVFLIALPLCLGIALASNAPLYSGILAGIIGGIIVGFFSGSNTSVSGPAAGLTAVVSLQISQLGSFEAFLAAVVIAGAIQIMLSIAKLGFIAAFFPSSVIKGLLWAIGIILVLKQIPHVLGHDVDPLGNKSFRQADQQNTFSEIVETIFDINFGAAIIGFTSIIILILWDKVRIFKATKIPAPIVVIALSVILNVFFKMMSDNLAIEQSHLVQVPIATTLRDSIKFLNYPDFSLFYQFKFYTVAVTIALVASLETLLNIEAVDKIDPKQSITPPNRELFAQGIGNLLAGLIGALPVTSVIVRSSVNINAGASTKLSTIVHGFLILGCVLLIPDWINKIPLAALAAILLMTGLKLADPSILIQMWREGKNQFLPFILTVLAIVFSDLLTGVLIGLGIAICFILHSNIRRPIKKTLEKHATGAEVLHIELPNQVSFFNRASLESTLKNVANGKHVLIDAHNTDYIDPDILDLIMDYQKGSSNHNVVVSLTGFKDKYPQLEDRIQYVDFTTLETQTSLTPERVLEILQAGNIRFREGQHLLRNIDRQLITSARGQYPMAVVLSCIDSRSPVELIFDLSIGDIFSVRIAGNVISRKVLGSIEYGCAVAGAKLVLVMGHTSCGAVKASVDFINEKKSVLEATGCVNLDSLIYEIQKSIQLKECNNFKQWDDWKKIEYCNDLAYKNVLRTMKKIREDSSTLDELVRMKKIVIVGAMYDIASGEVSFFQTKESSSLTPIKNKIVNNMIDKSFKLLNKFK
jgi:MFS superfamily sulfate permease-like transporter